MRNTRSKRGFFPGGAAFLILSRPFPTKGGGLHFGIGFRPLPNFQMDPRFLAWAAKFLYLLVKRVLVSESEKVSGGIFKATSLAKRV